MRLIVFLLFILTGCQSTPSNHDSLVKRTVEEFWSWSVAPSHCNEDWHTITFDSSENKLKFKTSKAIERADGVVSSHYEYEILEVFPSAFHLRLTHETRKDDSGQLVTWYLTFRDNNTYIWSRSDWGKVRATRDIKRCPIKI
jgi:hypothetical protein